MSVDHAQARDALSKLVSADTAPVLDVDDLDAALAAAQIADADGRMPGVDGYVPTWSLAWAAAVAMETRATRAALAAATPGITKFTADGATFERAAAPGSDHWLNLARHFRALAAREQGEGLNIIEIVREGPHRWPAAPMEDFWPWSPMVTTEPLLGPQR